MPERYLYEYAVIRVVPRVEREEFINVGIILFSKRKKFLRAKYVLHEEKLRMLFPEIDIEEIRVNLQDVYKRQDLLIPDSVIFPHRLIT